MFVRGNISIRVDLKFVIRNGARTLSGEIEVGMMGKVEGSGPICNSFGLN